MFFVESLIALPLSKGWDLRFFLEINAVYTIVPIYYPMSL